MKKVDLPAWKSNSCLHNCMVATVKYFNIKNQLNIVNKVMDLPVAKGDLVWATDLANIILENSNLKVTMYDNDIGMKDFADKGLIHLYEKYGDEGMYFIQDHFKNPGRLLESAVNFLNQKNKKILYRNISKEEIIDFTISKKSIVLINIDFNKLHNKNATPWVHYCVIVDYKRETDVFVLKDPVYPDKTLTFSCEELSQAQSSLRNEVMHLVVSK